MGSTMLYYIDMLFYIDIAIAIYIYTYSYKAMSKSSRSTYSYVDVDVYPNGVVFNTPGKQANLQVNAIKLTQSLLLKLKACHNIKN
jgi:hypothetical protein